MSSALLLDLLSFHRRKHTSQILIQTQRHTSGNKNVSRLVAIFKITIYRYLRRNIAEGNNKLAVLSWGCVICTLRGVSPVPFGREVKASC